GDGLVTLRVRAGDLYRALELFFALQRSGDGVVRGRGLRKRSEDGADNERDRGRARDTHPPYPTSPSGLPGSSHASRIVAPRGGPGQGFLGSHLARCARTESIAPPPPTARARAKTLPTSCQTKVCPNERGRTS